ncbi:interleukin-18 isoform X1 [Nannospalax galili]|uniref:interleukin-18 isoform X1 n=1 Tax=Nannospalax galili TaxID=1026970 RepID=UPI0004ED683B|nr:interleukin-18 isoform X1 [Nannospalax galili]
MAAAPAEGAYINLIEMKFDDDTLYFIPEKDEDLESDHFAKLEPTYTVIRNVHDQVLFIDRGKQAVFEDMTDADLEANKARLIIYMYKDTEARGLAVTISMKEKKMTLSCKNKVISFKEVDPPENINDTKSDLIFFQRNVPGYHNKMVFESSLYEGHFLACKQENDRFKLILKKDDDDADKSIMFTVEQAR